MRLCETCGFKKFGVCSNNKSDMYKKSCHDVKICGKWEPPHTCINCKNLGNMITEEPCFICNHGNKWENNENETTF